MLTLEYFNNKKMYVSPIDEIKIYHETKELMSIWKNIVLKNSDKKITELTSEHQKILSNIIPYLKIEFKNNLIIGPQIDKQIVKILLWSASTIFSNKDIIDDIYSKTKNAISQYFHHEMLIKSYLILKETTSAIEVIKYMFNENHSGYYFAILKYDPSKYKDTSFFIPLVEYRNKSSIMLLAKGEKVDLKNVSCADLIEITKTVQEKIAEELLR